MDIRQHTLWALSIDYSCHHRYVFFFLGKFPKFGRKSLKRCLNEVAYWLARHMESNNSKH